MESCIRISLSEYIDPDQSQRFDHSGRNEIWREPFPPARTCDTFTFDTASDFLPPESIVNLPELLQTPSPLCELVLCKYVLP